MCLVWKIIGFNKHSNHGPKHLGSFERQNWAIFLALVVCMLTNSVAHLDGKFN